MAMDGAHIHRLVVFGVVEFVAPWRRSALACRPALAALALLAVVPSTGKWESVCPYYE
jgi:hypothetical protein